VCSVQTRTVHSLHDLCVNRSREFNSIKNEYNLTDKDDGEFWYVCVCRCVCMCVLNSVCFSNLSQVVQILEFSFTCDNLELTRQFNQMRSTNSEACCGRRFRSVMGLSDCAVQKWLNESMSRLA